MTAIHGNRIPLIEQYNGHVGMPVMLSFAGHFTRAAVDATVEVHKYDFHLLSFNLAPHFPSGTAKG